MRLTDVRAHPKVDGVRQTATVRRQNGGQFEIYFDFQMPAPSDTSMIADAFASALLIPAMRSGESLEVDPPISPQLCFSLPRIRDIFHVWFPKFSRISIRTTPQVPRHHQIEPRAATFFSGGVDSFYSLLKHKRGLGTLPAPLTHIIFMRGIETSLQESQEVEATEHWVREVAAQSGVQCIAGVSNLRTCLQGPATYIHWERHYHGSALAALALALSSGLGYICVPSAFSYNHLIPHGSTPLLDEMYSTERLRVIHDGAEVTRPAKVARILEWDRDLVLAYLRVCINNSGGAFNCGRCYKCVRTAIPLRVLGAWEQARTFRDKTTDHWEEMVSEDHLGPGYRES